MTTTDQTFDLSRLIGKHVRLWPYLRGVYARDFLYRLWSVIEAEGDGVRVFWGNPDPPTTRMDLPAFCTFMSDPGRHVLVATSLDGESILGAIWFDDITAYRAFSSIYMVPTARGMAALEACRMAAEYMHTTYGLEQLWALTPWREAGKLIQAVGFERVATLPEFACVEDIRHDVGVYRKMRSAHG